IATAPRELRRQKERSQKGTDSYRIVGRDCGDCRCAPVVNLRLSLRGAPRGIDPGPAARGVGGGRPFGRLAIPAGGGALEAVTGILFVRFRRHPAWRSDSYLSSRQVLSAGPVVLVPGDLRHQIDARLSGSGFAAGVLAAGSQL